MWSNINELNFQWVHWNDLVQFTLAYEYLAQLSFVSLPSNLGDAVPRNLQSKFQVLQILKDVGL